MTATAIPNSEVPGQSPLAGKRIIVTRAPHQASHLADRLSALGAVPILVPTIEICPPASFAALDAALGSLSGFDLIAFTSANAVQAFVERAQKLGISPAPRRIAVVGPATARALGSVGLRADVIPTTFTAEALAEVLRPGAPGLRVLIAIAEDAPPTLSSALEAAGARVTVAAAYGNRIPGGSLETIVSLFADESNLPHAVTFTSASTAANLHALIESVGIALPDTVVRASIGPITSRALADLGLPPHLQAKESTIPALVVALTDYFQAVEQP